MKEIAVIGTGYVGAVTGACLADQGHNVTLVDNDLGKVETINNGRSPIVENGLEDVIWSARNEGNLRATMDLGHAVATADVVLMALPTPSNEDGSADMHYVFDMARELGPLIKPGAVVATRSTVPVGTTDEVRRIISASTDTPFYAVSNPEFLAEGVAVRDTLHPSRVVVGADEEAAIDIMREVYRPFLLDGRNNFVAIDPRSSELSKLAANAMLAAQIAMVNVIAEVAEKAGADYRSVQAALTWDPRLGRFLHPGPGFGGSCFDKDVKNLATVAADYGINSGLIDMIITSNEHQKRRLAGKVIDFFGGDVSGKKIGLWGLSFKPGTDDIRQSPALTVIDELTSAGAEVVAYDPQAIASTERYYDHNGRIPKLSFIDDKYRAVDGADALVLVTEWDQFRNPDAARLASAMRRKNIFDGRAVLNFQELSEAGFYVNTVGRGELESSK